MCKNRKSKVFRDKHASIKADVITTADQEVGKTCYILLTVLMPSMVNAVCMIAAVASHNRMRFRLTC